MGAVVRVHEPSLAAVETFSVRARQAHSFSAERPGILVEPLHSQRVDVHLIQPLLHGGVVRLVFGIRKVTRNSSEPPRHLVGCQRNHPHILLLIHQIRTNQQLLRLRVNHPVGRRPADAALE